MERRTAQYTAGGDLHPALKTYDMKILETNVPYFYYSNVAAKCNSFFFTTSKICSKIKGKGVGAVRRREESCCFTGHRPGKLPWGEEEQDPRCLRLKRILEQAVRFAYEQRGKRHFLCGMAMGSDLYFAETVLQLRNQLPITLEAVIPCPSQANAWPEQQRLRYRRLMEECDEETLIQHHYDPGCMQRRNRYMVDHSSFLIAVHDGLPGGTRQTIEYALRRELEILDIPPLAEENTDILCYRLSGSCLTPE